MRLALLIKVRQFSHVGKEIVVTSHTTSTSIANHKAAIDWREKFVAAGIHFSLSIAVAALTAVLVFGFWYPYPYREISGGRELFLLVVTVDVILGPLLTFIIFSRRKPRAELLRDLAIIGIIQLAALAYGTSTVFVARPVHLVFEIDRLRVVHAVDIDRELTGKAPPGVEVMPLWGPTLLAVRPFKDEKESFDATMAALGGADLGARPDLWQSYDQSRADVLRAAKPVSQLKARFAAQGAEIDAVLHKAGRKPEATVYLPMVARSVAWTAFVDPATAEVVGFFPLDSF
jgi:hypothetical protein